MRWLTCCMGCSWQPWWWWWLSTTGTVVEISSLVRSRSATVALLAILHVVIHVGVVCVCQVVKIYIKNKLYIKNMNVSLHVHNFYMYVM
jgi:hypothetical protein